jgi:hypothetical protein
LHGDNNDDGGSPTIQLNINANESDDLFYENCNIPEEEV